MSDLELRRQLTDELRPVGLIENALVDQILFALLALRQSEELRERAQAQGLMLRATAELRRLRADRAKHPQPVPVVETPVAAPETETTEIPRSAPCPCGSGLKYKRCHGWNAPGATSIRPTHPHPAKSTRQHTEATPPSAASAADPAGG